MNCQPSPLAFNDYCLYPSGGLSRIRMNSYVRTAFAAKPFPRLFPLGPSDRLAISSVTRISGPKLNLPAGKVCRCSSPEGILIYRAACTNRYTYRGPRVLPSCGDTPRPREVLVEVSNPLRCCADVLGRRSCYSDLPGFCSLPCAIGRRADSTGLRVPGLSRGLRALLCCLRRFVVSFELKFLFLSSRLIRGVAHPSPGVSDPPGGGSLFDLLLVL